LTNSAASSSVRVFNSAKMASVFADMVDSP
jgi:hypothetical protein